MCKLSDLILIYVDREERPTICGGICAERLKCRVHLSKTPDRYLRGIIMIGQNADASVHSYYADIYHVFLAKEVMGIDHSPVSIPNTSHTKTPGRGIADNCEGSVEASAAQPSKEAASIGRVRSAGSSILLSMRSCFSSRPKA